MLGPIVSASLCITILQASQHCVRGVGSAVKVKEKKKLIFAEHHFEDNFMLCPIPSHVIKPHIPVWAGNTSEMYYTWIFLELMGPCIDFSFVYCTYLIFNTISFKDCNWPADLSAGDEKLYVLQLR